MAANSSKEHEKKRKRAMRNLGYGDGLAGRDVRHNDPDYKDSHRRGKEARVDMLNERR